MRHFLAIVVFLLLLPSVAHAQVLQGQTCGGVTAGTTFTCTTTPTSVNNSTTIIGINFNTNVCATLNTPSGWSQVTCQNYSGGNAAAVYYKNSVTGDSNPVFSWTGNATAQATATDEEGVLTSNQLDASANSTSGSAGTSVTVPTITTTSPLEHVVNYIFTDSASTGVTITPAAPAGTMVNFNTTSFDSFVTEQRIKAVTASVGGGTATLSASNDWAAITLAFKTINTPVGPVVGDVVPGTGTFKNINLQKDLGTIASNGTAACPANISICTFTNANSSAGVSITWASPPANQLVYIGMRENVTVPVTWAANFFAYNAGTQTYSAMNANSDYNFALSPDQTNSTLTPMLMFWSDGTNLYLYSLVPRGDFNILTGRQLFTTLNGSSFQDLTITNGGLNVTSGGAKVVGGSGVIAVPQAFSSFTICSGTNEGGMGTETTSTAACSAGTVATNGGTTHCQIYCNGTNWIQTGR